MPRLKKLNSEEDLDQYFSNDLTRQLEESIEIALTPAEKTMLQFCKDAIDPFSEGDNFGLFIDVAGRGYKLWGTGYNDVFYSLVKKGYIDFPDEETGKFCLTTKA